MSRSETIRSKAIRFDLHDLPDIKNVNQSQNAKIEEENISDPKITLRIFSKRNKQLPIKPCTILQNRNFDVERKDGKEWNQKKFNSYNLNYNLNYTSFVITVERKEKKTSEEEKEEERYF